MAIIIPRRWLSILATLALVASLIILAISGRALLQARDYNQALLVADWQRAATHPSAHGALAAAYARASQQEDFAETVRAFARAASSATEPGLKSLARYDLATLYLQRGLELLADEQPDLANPLLELAKGLYRERLRLEPDHWNSKYNLELALLAAPDVADTQLPPGQRNPGPSSRSMGTGPLKRELP